MNLPHYLVEYFQKIKENPKRSDRLTDISHLKLGVAQIPNNKQYKIEDEIRCRLMNVIYLFDFCSDQNFYGDAYLFFKYFNQLVHNTISFAALLSGDINNWKDPINFLKYHPNTIEREYIASLFPPVDLEDANIIKSGFIDWFDSILDELIDEYGAGILPLEKFDTEIIMNFLESILDRDYLTNFRGVKGTKHLFRTPDPARYLTRGNHLKNYLVENNIKVVVDLRGENHTFFANGYKVQRVENGPKPTPPLFDSLGIKRLIMEFNEPLQSKVKASGYVRKLVHLKETVRDVMLAFVENDGALLFHCASGKDRTGVIAALFQKLMGHSDEDVIFEYILSGHDAKSQRMKEVLTHIEEKGGIVSYLELCGIDKDTQARISKKLHN